MAKSNAGNDQQAKAMGGGVALGTTGTATATSSTSLTNSGASWTASGWIGQIVIAGSVYGVITANTSTVITVDRWYNPATPGGAAGSTPSGTTAYIIPPGGAPAIFHAITADATSPAASNTTLTGEIATASGGLVRKIATYAHTTSAASYTLTTTWTANASDVLPVTIAKLGNFTGMGTGQMVFETLLNATATLSAVSDALTVTHTVALS